MSSLANHLVWLDKAGRSNISLVGSKAANLGELFRLGLRVPRGVCITTAAYDYFLKKSGIFFDLEQIITAQAGDPLGASAHARDLIFKTEIPDLLKNQIAQAYSALISDRCSQSLAVRSSSLDEDLANDSFAGLYDSYLHISELAALLQRIKACWTSFWSERALVYRMARGFLNRPITGAVILQHMVEAEAAGVLFTRNPVENGDVSMALEVVRGTGEQIVSGDVTPDRYVISKPDLRIASRRIALRDDRRALVSASRHRPAWEGQTEQPEILSDQEVLELCRFGLFIEKSFHQPQDIEWARANGSYYFLQARPITSTQDDLGETVDPAIWTRNNIDERFPEPLKPLEASFVNECVFTPGCSQLFRALGFDEAKGAEAFRVFHGLLHVNKQLFTSALHGLPESVTRQIFDRKGEQPAPRISPSWPLAVILVRLLKMVFTGHRKFERKLPAFVADYQRFHNCNYEEMQLAELSGQLAEIGDSIRRISAGHMQSIIVAEMLVAMLTSICPDKNILLLIRGMDANKTVEMEWRFAELCSAAAGDETVYSILMSAGPGQAMERLKNQPHARQFLWLLNWFLEEFGHRSTKYQLSHPRWREDPAQLLDLIKTSISVPKHSRRRLTNDNDYKAMLKTAERKLVRSGLDRILPWKKAVFRLLLRYARIYCGILRENEGFYITMPFPEVKRILACIARELVAESVLERTEDIYFLALPEVIQASREGLRCDLGNTVAVRKRAYFHHPSEPAEVSTSSETVLSGTAASPGLASGQARILSSPGDGFEPGNILVTHSLNAAWVPLLRCAGGVVTNVGGMLSHAAVIAREFHVPAVLGAGAATTSIQQGQMITVDGTNGKVFLTTQ
jgi:phosphohistidine swiveling domain-containing protein